MKVLDKRLHYHDVMIVPQVSDSVMNSRSEAIVKRILGSKYGRASINSVPVCVANMDTCGTIKMAEEIGADGGMVALHKFYDIETLINLNNKYFFNSHFYTLGINDINKLQDLIDTTGIVPNLICLDAPNGYLQSFINAVKTIRHLCPNSFIMAGNVVTSTATVKIIEAGADMAKVGISQGCFIKGTKVRTKNGMKNIESIKIGDEVLTHNKKYKKVIGTTKRLGQERIIDINGIKCTPEHMFYVIDKYNKNLVNEENVHLYAKWVQAQELSDEYLLIKIAT